MGDIVPPDPRRLYGNAFDPNSRFARQSWHGQREMESVNDPSNLAQVWGVGAGTHDEVMDEITGGWTPFVAIPMGFNRGEMYEALSIFGDDSDEHLLEDSPMLPPNSPTEGYQYQNQVANYVDKKTNQAAANMAGGAPAPITEMPTSTTNPERPRTVAAGYDPDRKVLTVVFRDGTYYNYYDITALEWNNFKNARSKGKFIYSHLDGTRFGYSKPRGVADVGSLPPVAREALYRVTRTGQIMRKGFTGKQSDRSRRGVGKNVYSPGNLGGTGRKRAKRTP